MKRMKKYLIIGVAVLGAGIAALLIYDAMLICCTPEPEGRPSESFVVTSGDGAATLEIPTGGLTGDVSPDGIKLTKIGAEDAGIGLEEGEYGAVTYRLEPKGLTLNQPAVFRLVQEPAGVAMPIVMHVSGDNDETLEIIDGVIVNTDFEKGSTVIEVPVGHFSKIVLFNYIDGKINIQAVPITPVGDFVHASADVELSQFYRRNLDYSMRGRGSISSAGVLTPSGPIEGRPSVSYFPIETRSDDFICLEEGDGTLNWSFTFIGRQKYVRVVTADGRHFDSIDEASQSGSKTVDSWNKERDIETTMNYSVSADCGEGMVRACPISTVVCEESGRGATGYYECDPLTGEAINDILLDMETGEPLELVCP